MKYCYTSFIRLFVLFVVCGSLLPVTEPSRLLATPYGLGVLDVYACVSKHYRQKIGLSSQNISFTLQSLHLQCQGFESCGR